MNLEPLRYFKKQSKPGTVTTQPHYTGYFSNNLISKTHASTTSAAKLLLVVETQLSLVT